MIPSSNLGFESMTDFQSMKECMHSIIEREELEDFLGPESRFRADERDAPGFGRSERGGELELQGNAEFPLLSDSVFVELRKNLDSGVSGAEYPCIRDRTQTSRSDS